jgi:signal transduction histidine kinase/thioredoxin-like negative regulator of GroEL
MDAGLPQMISDRIGSVALVLAILALAGTAVASDTDFDREIERIRELNVTAPWPESQALIESLKPRLEHVTPRQRNTVELIEARNLTLAGNWSEALDLLERIREREPDSDQQLRAYVLSANITSLHGDYEAAFTFLIHALRMLEEVDAPSARSQALHMAAYLFSDIHDHQRALEYGKQAVQEVRRTQEPHELCYALQRLAVAEKRAAPVQALMRTLQDALVACSEAEDPVFTPIIKQMIGEGHLMLGELDEAIRWLREGLEEVRHAGFFTGILEGRSHLARALVAAGELDEAKALLDGLPEELEAAGHWEALATSRSLLSEIAERRGDHEVALRQARMLVEAHRRHMERISAMQVAYLQMELDVTRRDQQIRLLEESHRHNAMIRNSAIGGVFLMTILALVLFNRYRFRVRANRLIEKKNRELATLDEIVGAINSHESFDAVLSILLRQTVEFFPNAEHGEVLVRNRDLGLFEVASVYAETDIGVMPESLEIDEGRRRYLSRGREIADGIFLHNDPRLPAAGNEDSSQENPSSLIAMSIVIEGEIEGFLVLGRYSPGAPFHETDAARFSRIREHAISALTRVRSLEKLRRENQRADNAIRQLRAAQKDLERTLREVESANAAKTEFLTRVSHELRTPLHSVIGYSEKLLRILVVEGLGKGVEDVRHIHGSGNHLLALINEILDLSRIEAGQTEIQCEEIHVYALLDEVVTTVAPQVEANGNRLEIKCPDDVGILYSDSVKLRQILLNLLSNAAKFTSDGAIHLMVERRQNVGSEGDLIFRVVDTGIGIKQEYLDRVFDPFIQGGNDIGRKFGGTGLGLTVSRRLCELLGGEINAESTYGAGAAFTVRLPSSRAGMVLEKAPPVVAEPNAARGMPNVNGGRILVVEDNRINMKLMADFLEMEGFEVLGAKDGRQGIEMARRERPDLILMDMSLPDMGGDEVTRVIRADATCADVPIIGVSAYATDEAASRALEAGCNGYETKPVDFPRLILTIRRYLERIP